MADKIDMRALKEVLRLLYIDDFPGARADARRDLEAMAPAMARSLVKAERMAKRARYLAICAQTSGGTAGKDEDLVCAIESFAHSHAAFLECVEGGE
jgi:hypothetical protein